MNVLFVCTGNTCRSPMAEAILTKMSDGSIKAKSVGVFAASGNEASAYAKMVMEKNEVPYNHVSVQIADEHVEWADVILTMTAQHKEVVRAFYPAQASKLYTLKEYVNEKELDIQDPFGGSLKVYENTFNDLYVHIKALYNNLKEGLSK